MENHRWSGGGHAKGWCGREACWDRARWRLSAVVTLKGKNEEEEEGWGLTHFIQEEGGQIFSETDQRNPD